MENKLEQGNKLEKTAETVERMGIFFEQAGLRPLHGRVFAYLLLSEPPYRDFYDIQDFLKASKSTISLALNFLMDKGMVKYITFSGDRKRYFQVNMQDWFGAIMEEIRQVTTLKKLLEDVLAHRSEVKYVEFNDELNNMIEFHKQLAENLDTFIEEWKQKER